MIDREKMGTLIRSGRYFIGDPCQVLNAMKPEQQAAGEFRTKEWEALLALTYTAKGDPIVTGGCDQVGNPSPYNGSNFFAVCLGEDGEYHDDHGGQYLVDSGLMAVVHESLWSPGCSLKVNSGCEDALKGELVVGKIVEVSEDNYLCVGIRKNRCEFYVSDNEDLPILINVAPDRYDNGE